MAYDFSSVNRFQMPNNKESEPLSPKLTANNMLADACLAPKFGLSPRSKRMEEGVEVDIAWDDDQSEFKPDYDTSYPASAIQWARQNKNKILIGVGVFAIFGAVTSTSKKILANKHTAKANHKALDEAITGGGPKSAKARLHQGLNNYALSKADKLGLLAFTMEPTVSNSPTMSSAPSNQPTVSSEPSVSSAPSNEPSLSSAPSGTPTSAPSGMPTSQPSSAPSDTPTSQPSNKPSVSTEPSMSSAPSGTPTSAPSGTPTSQPSSAPSDMPSSQPSNKPTVSVAPSGTPSTQPSNKPTVSVAPSDAPSSQPTKTPSQSPTSFSSTIASSFANVTKVIEIVEFLTDDGFETTATVPEIEEEENVDNKCLRDGEQCNDCLNTCCHGQLGAGGGWFQCPNGIMFCGNYGILGPSLC
jgi:hypothetical protein